MRACVCVMLLAISAALAACGAVDHSGDITNSVFASGKLPVEPNLAAQSESTSSENRTAESISIEEELDSLTNEQPKAERRPKSVQVNEPRRSVQASTPAAPPPAAAAPAALPPAAAAPAASSPAAPPPASPATAPPPLATPSPAAPPPATPASAKPAPPVAQAPPSSAAEPPSTSSQVESKRLNTPWPEPPRSGTFAH